MWKKEFDVEHIKSFEYVAITAIIFFILGLIYQKPLAIVGMGMFVIFLTVYKIYDRSVGTKLQLKNEPRQVKLFPGEKASLRFEIENNSIFPLINGSCHLQLGSSIYAYTLVKKEKQYWEPLSIPLSIIQSKTTVIDIPIEAKQRGVALITNIRYTFPHLLSFSSISLKYMPSYQTEVIVFPKALPVSGVEQIFHSIPGTGRVNLSPFEDIQSPIGTRTYQYSDPFYKINWKASAKSQQLQTTEYEKVIDHSYVFVINIANEYRTDMVRFNKMLEDYLSYTAYLCEYTFHHNSPFEIFMNARKPGSIPYIHLPEGEGKNHYARSLELLARISKQSLSVSFDKMLYQIGKQLVTPKTIIFVGDVPANLTQITRNWKQKQVSLYQIIQMDEEQAAYVKPLKKEVSQYAT
ncbi:DUF58 domain-containing protein [Virgibacillus soli]|uniref:DUF58 domain-containing protein n=1 Tax=Paracerasibacillus soli TaxID=480284 RepID=A0ABU5CR67_9BACI|nr:DUF58 domain-containing protein [Virgibacillus soli]MDY0408826.1 DUF58 domain-containing protein [Virgibacillus soli]